MAESVAEVVRDKKPEAPAEAEQLFTPKPDAPSKPSDPLDAIFDLNRRGLAAYQQVYGDYLPRREAAEKKELDAEQESARVLQQVVKPGLQAAREAAGRPTPPLPQQIPVPPQPDIKPRPFLAGEKDSLGKVVQSLGLMAQMALGAGKAPVAALKSLTGAMNGWAEGDSERAQRDWTAYLEQVRTIRQENRQALELWDAAMRAHGSNQQAAQMQLAADLAEYGYTRDALTAARHGTERVLADLTIDTGMVDKIIGFTSKIQFGILTEQHRQAEEKIRQQHVEDVERRYQQTRREEQARHDRDYAERVREFNLKRQQESSGEALTPQAIELAAQQYYTTGVLPAMGMGAKSTVAREKVMNRAGEIASAAGTTGADFVARTQFAKASQGELTTLMRQRGQVMAFASTADQNLDAAQALSKKVDRSGVPVLNRWILAGRKSLEGDPDVTDFNIFNNRAVTEIARLTSSATGGGTSTDTARREAAELLETAFTPEQYESAVKALKQEVTFRRKGYEDQIKAVESNVRRLLPTPGGGGGATPPAPKAGMIRVKRKSDGATGWLDRKDLGDLYEEIAQ